MKEFFESIQYLFEHVLFVPLNALRSMHSWWGANFLNWIFMAIGAGFMIYWVLQLKKFNDNNEEDKDVTAHSYL